MNEETTRLRIRFFSWADADDFYVLESAPELLKEYNDEAIYGVLRGENGNKIDTPMLLSP